MRATGPDILPRYRTLKGPAGIIQRILLVLIPIGGIIFILRVPTYAGVVVWKEQYVGLFFGLMLAGLFLCVPGRKRAPRDSVPWYDVVFAIAGLTSGLYVTAFWPHIIYSMAVVSPERIILGSIAILLVLEALRRLIGWPLIVLCLLFIFYARWADIFPSPITGSPSQWDRLVQSLYLGRNGLLPMVKLSSTIAVAFILFGNIFTTFGAARVFTDLALAVMGRFRGGSAKVAIIASSLVGTMTGGAVTNVMITGPVTIPMMKASGYPPHHAAAIEACSSTGAQIMPPVMGITAFLMAEFLEISYATVALAALIPAVLYYLALFVQVDMEAAKRGIRGRPRVELPSLRSVAARAWVFLGPLAILGYTLFILRLPPDQAGVITALSSLGLLLLIKENRRGFLSKTVGAFEGTTKVLFAMTAILAAAGCILGALTISGLAFTAGFLLVKATGGSAILLLIVAGAASYILGMGMPTPPAYILVASLVAPGLVMQGMPELAAHLFVFYFAMIANFTPPVAIGAFAAAGIAEADAIRTGYVAMRLGVLAYVVPFLFIFSPPLLLSGSAAETALAVVRTVAGTVLLGLGLVGYFVRTIDWIKRLALILAAIGLLVAPGLLPFSWVFNLLGTAGAVSILLIELRSHVKSV
ncbi:TRAP transporter permease [Chloroflexota bacterium]